MKSLTSKAVPPDRRLPNQLHGWLAKSALNLTPYPTTPTIFSLFFLSKVQVIYFIATFAPASVALARALILPLYFSASCFLSFIFCPACVDQSESEGAKRGGGSETREERKVFCQFNNANCKSVSEQVVSFSHPVGSTVTGIISVTGSDATQSLVSGGFLFDAGFNLLSGLASLLLVALIWLGFNLFHNGMETRAGDNRLRRVYKVGFWYYIN